MTGGDPSNKLGQNHRLAETSTSEQPGFTTTYKRSQQVHNFDTGFEKLGTGRKLSNRRCFAMDRPSFLRVDVTTAIDRFAEHVEHAAESLFSDWYGKRFARVNTVLTTDQAIRAAKCNATHSSATQVLLNFSSQIEIDTLVSTYELDRIVNVGQRVLGKLSVKRRSNYLGDLSYVFGCSGHILLSRSYCQGRTSRQSNICMVSVRIGYLLSASTPPMISMISPVI